jgi:hypothetical protein
MCNWESKDKRIRCDRKSLISSDFCLFHKPNKSDEEIKLFWRIINFRIFSQSITDLQNQFYTKRGVNSAISEQLSIERNNIENSNFSSEEKSNPNFKNLKNEIVSLYYESKISGRGNMSYPDFNGFIFPKTDTFEYIFNYIYNPSTDGTIIFKECIFEGFISFFGFNFLGKTTFEECKFNRGVIFTKSIFHHNVSFINSSLNTGYRIHGCGMFQDTKFIGRKVLFDKVDGLIEFDSDFSEKTDFDLIRMSYPTDYGTASFGEKAYRLAKIQKSRIGELDKAADYNYLEKCYKGYQILPEPYFWDKGQKGFKKIQIFNYLKNDNAYKKIRPKIIDLIFKYSIGYGEKPNRALRMLSILVFVFALIYMFIGDIKVNSNLINYNLGFSEELLSIEYWNKVLRDFGNCLYFSIVTLTTVGYGDITSSSGIGKFFSGLEMFLGVTFVGAWTATLLRKLIK